jgi:methylmalonyl-CoA decarboxylase subunit alpha
MPKTRTELTAKLDGVEAQVVAGEPRAVERQHSEGKLTARERVTALLDPGSFVEEFQLAETHVTDFGMAERRQPTDGVVAGYGTVDGRLVFVYAQDRTVLAGAVGSAHGEKIAYVTEVAQKVGAPVVGLLDSVGARIQEGLDVTRAIGRIFYANTLASGAVPQISAIMGPCIGVGSYSPALTDFVLMVRGTSQMFITGPPVVKEVLGEDVTMEDLGGAKVHGEISGVADLIVDDDAACLAQIRRLLGFLPSSHREPPLVVPTEDPVDRDVEGLEALVPEDLRKPYNMVQVIRRLVDDGDFLELKPRWARNMVIGFGRLGGGSVGFVANQPNWLGGAIDIDAADKAARFIRFCDAFNVPLVTLVDVPGFFPGTKQERGGIIRHGAKMLYAYAEATVPKITVYLRKGYGGAKQAMCTREMGADQVFVWPGVELAVMGAPAAVNVLYRREIEQAADPEAVRQQRIEEFSERFSGPFDALAKMFSHAPLRPPETRRRLIQSLRMLATKAEERPPKKHGVMPV